MAEKPYFQFKQCNDSNFMYGRTKNGVKHKIQWIVIHFTAGKGDTAKNNADYFARCGGLNASAHFFVDENEIWQTVNLANTAWHCGSETGYYYNSCRNVNSIGIEMCSRTDSNGRYYIKEETVQRAVALVQELMAKYNVPASRVLRHYDVTGKACPEPFVRQPAQWERFKQEVSEVEKQKKIKLNGKEKTVHVIEKDGYNYIKLQDLRDDKISIGYDGVPVVEVK